MSYIIPQFELKCSELTAQEKNVFDLYLQNHSEKKDSLDTIGFYKNY